MINKVKETIEKYNLIDENDKIVVGVSGGPDSICLLNILYTLGANVIVCHVNHGLRENGNLDEKFVKAFCDSRNIKFFVKRINLKDKDSLNGMSTEEAGRKARYDFFDAILKQESATKIATAHNLNDNVETVLLNEFRGSGVSGLKGISPIAGNIIRPLIECSRKEIERYCLDNNLKPRHDESNDDVLYTRNKIRLELIPYIENNINTNAINTISRLSQIVSEEEDFVEQEVKKVYDEVFVSNDDFTIVLNLKVFNKQHILIRKRIILKAIYNLLGNAKDIEKVHVDDIVKLCENNVGGKYLTPKKYLKVSVKNHKIFIEKVWFFNHIKEAIYEKS